VVTQGKPEALGSQGLPIFRSAQVEQALEHLAVGRPSVHDIAVDNHQLGPHFLEVGQDCLERRQISVNIRENCNTHSLVCRCKRVALNGDNAGY